MNPLRSVGARLGLALAVVVAAALILVDLIVVPSLERNLIDAKLHQLSEAAPGIGSQLLNSANYNIDETIQSAADTADARVVYFDPITFHPPRLRVYADSNPVTSADIENDTLAQRAFVEARAVKGTTTEHGIRYAEVAYPVFGGPVVLLRASLHDSLRSINLVRRRLVVAGLIALAASLLVGYLLASLFARRIRRLERAADRIASGDFSEPVVDSGRDELAELAAAFERMRQRLAQLEHARREFIANASHELRTPLFSLGGFLELMADEELDPKTQSEFMTTMREQVDRLTKLATELLDLSRLDAGRLTVERERLDLVDLADTLAEEFRAVARSTNHPLSIENGGEVHAFGDEERALQIGRILLENALVHTPAGTPVRIEVDRRDGEALLTIEDEGPGYSGRAHGTGLRPLLPPRGLEGLRERSRARDRAGARRAHERVDRAGPAAGPDEICARSSGCHGGRTVFTGKRTPRRTVATVSPMRLPALAVVTVVAAVLGGGAALGIGKGTGWLDEGTKTVVVKAQPSQAASLPASATSKVLPLQGSSFDPQRIFAARSPGVVTIFAYFGDPRSEATERAQGSGFVISSEGLHPHQFARDHECRRVVEGPGRAASLRRVRRRRPGRGPFGRLGSL